MHNEEQKIQVTLRGPYKVSGNIPLNKEAIVASTSEKCGHWKKNHSYNDASETYYLCRCGHSSNKPFCDGTHVTNDFVGKETASKLPFKEQAQTLEGELIDLLDQEDLCAVARFCHLTEDVWQLVMEAKTPEKVELATYEACMCPSGRLVILSKDGAPIEPPLRREVSWIEDIPASYQGPLWIKGGIRIEDVDGNPYEVRNRVTLCVCGESDNKPFCDASHLGCPHMKL